MKLRNKKTGDAVYVDFQIPLCNNNDVLGAYSVTSLKELNESFEDYIMAEPLIKDEKIRKAVRAWAETYGIVAVRHIVLSFDKTEHSVFETGYGRDYSAITLETELELPENETYTISELCGEEE